MLFFGKPSYLRVPRKQNKTKKLFTAPCFQDYFPHTLVFRKKRDEIALVTHYEKPASKMPLLTKKRKNAISPKLGDFARGEAPAGTSEQQQQQQNGANPSRERACLQRRDERDSTGVVIG